MDDIIYLAFKYGTPTLVMLAGLFVLRPACQALINSELPRSGGKPPLTGTAAFWAGLPLAAIGLALVVLGIAGFSPGYFVLFNQMMDSMEAPASSSFYVRKSV